MQTWTTRLGYALIAFGLVCSSALAVEVRDVRLSSAPESARVELDLTGSARHSLRVTHHPERVRLEVTGAHWKSRGSIPVKARGLVTGIRFTMKGRRLYAFMTVSRSCKVDSFLMKPHDGSGYKLVVNLKGTAATVATVPVRAVPAQAAPARTLPAGAVPVPAMASQVVTVRNPAPILPIRAQHAPHELRDLVVAIDAGHGGEDPGAIGKNGLREKDVVLAIAKELYAKVNAEPGMRAVLTRDGDYFLPLRERMRRARALSADLFVSIHADSISDRSIDGSSVYILSQKGATDEASRWLAARENAADLIGGVSLEDKSDVLASILLDVSQSASLSASESAAERVLRQLSQSVEVRKNRVQEARFMVLKSPDIPSMLVETAYISNLQEEERLRAPAQRARLATAIHRGLRDYFYANPPAGTRIAQFARNAQLERGGQPREASTGEIRNGGTGG